jgi:hypothetical protein
MMKRSISLMIIAAVCMQMAAQPAVAMNDKDEAAAAAVAAIAILGIAALSHNKHHYRNGYEPSNGDETAEFERGYRDGLHGYHYWEDSRTPSYAEGYHAGDHERENSVAHRRPTYGQKAPPMAYQGCAQIVAQNSGVAQSHVHFTKVRSPAKHEWQIEAGVGHSYMVCKMRDSGELPDLTGGRLYNPLNLERSHNQTHALIVVLACTAAGMAVRVIAIDRDNVVPAFW